MDYIQANLIDPVSKVLYTYVLVYLLVGAGLYFTIRTRAVQFRYFPRMLRQYHLWCSVHQPDSNGIAGLVREIEDPLAAVPGGQHHLPYRPGPTWPLSTK